MCVYPPKLYIMGPKTNKKTIAQNYDSGDEESLMDMMKSMRSELTTLNSKIERESKLSKRRLRASKCFSTTL